MKLSYPQYLLLGFTAHIVMRCANTTIPPLWRRGHGTSDLGEIASSRLGKQYIPLPRCKMLLSFFESKGLSLMIAFWLRTPLFVDCFRIQRRWSGCRAGDYKAKSRSFQSHFVRAKVATREKYMLPCNTINTIYDGIFWRVVDSAKYYFDFQKA